MARAIWNGAISFGLVTIPVQLVSAVRSQRPRFHLLHAKDEAPVNYERVCEREAKPCPGRRSSRATNTRRASTRCCPGGLQAGGAGEDRHDRHPQLRARVGDRFALLRDAVLRRARKGRGPRVRAAARDRAQDRQGRRRAADPAAVAAPGGAVGQGRRLRADVAPARGRSGGDGFGQDAERRRACATASCSSRRAWSTAWPAAGSRSSTRINTRRTCPRSSRRRSRARAPSRAWARSVRASRRPRWRI